MQIALQDIRTLGYKKLAKFYLNDKDFFDNLQYLNTLYCTMKIPAYSLLNKWSCLSDELLSSDKIKGYTSFVYSLEPMIDFESPSNASKRKCRNMWLSIWDNFGATAGLADYQIILLRDFGLKLLFIISDCENEKIKLLCEDILKFYNRILKWSIFTQQESNFTKNNLSFIDVLSMLVEDDIDEFSSSLDGLY